MPSENLSNSFIKRKENESNFQYKVRLCMAKLNKEHDLDWSELVELLELNCSSDHLRKLSYAWKEMLAEQEQVAHNTLDNELLLELEAKKKAIEIAKIQFQDQKREYKQYLRHEGRLDHLLKKMLETIKDDINNKKPLEWASPLPLSKTAGALALLLSDLHKGMITNNHWNKYNDDIFYQRLNQLTQEVLEHQKLTGANEIHVFELGDVISGIIHRMSKLSETENAVESTQKVAEALSELLSVLSNNFETVHYYNVKGNHDRAAARKEEEVRTESFHNFIVWYMKARLHAHQNIVFHDNQLDSEIIVAEILGKHYFAVHGHLDGLGKVVQDLTMMTRIFPTAVFLGHYHKNFENEYHGVDVIVNGSFGGTDDYAKDARLTSKPHQKLIWLNEHGRKATFYINF